MTITTKLTAAGLALAAITMAGCTTVPAPEAAPSSPSATIGSGSKIMPVSWSAITSAKKFGAERIDERAAGNALASGRPFLVGLPDGGNDACHTALLVPGDPAVWILNRSSMPTEGAALARVLLTYGCDAGMEIPGQVPNASAPTPTPPLDTAARDAAKSAGVPFIHAISRAGASAARVEVLLPGDSMPWILNATAPGVTGSELGREVDPYGPVGVAPTTGGVR